MSAYDNALFSENQPVNSTVGQASGWQSWLTAVHPNVTFLPNSGVPTLYWNGGAGTLEGMQIVATADGNTANQQWCEYGIRTHAVDGTLGTNALPGYGPWSTTFNAGTWQPGWQLAHGLISPCLTKSSGQTFIITWTLSVS